MQELDLLCRAPEGDEEKQYLLEMLNPAGDGYLRNQLHKRMDTPRGPLPPNEAKRLRKLRNAIEKGVEIEHVIRQRMLVAAFVQDQKARVRDSSTHVCTIS